MKRKLVLIALLVLPLLLYIYFSMAKHNSLYLPVITKNVSELPVAEGSAPAQLSGKITILGFLGNDAVKRKESIFNLNQKINNKFSGFNDFQIVMVLPEGDEQQVDAIRASLKNMGDINKWKFVYTDPKTIQKIYASLKVKEPLGTDLGTDRVFIIDKKRCLRGRKGNFKGDSEFRDSYSTFSAAEVHNQLTDDVKIVLREYRLALKRNTKREI